jgi:hypothetical protein
MSIIVAVAVPSFPPQHSLILGHFASSQTVAKFRDFTVLCNLSKFSFVLPDGADIRNQSGLAGAFDDELFEEVGPDVVCEAREFADDVDCVAIVGETKRVNEVSADSSSFLNSASRFRGAATLENKRVCNTIFFISSCISLLKFTKDFKARF